MQKMSNHAEVDSANYKISSESATSEREMDDLRFKI